MRRTGDPVSTTMHDATDAPHFRPSAVHYGPMLLYVDANFASPYALVAFVSLLEKGLTFDIETLDLAARANRGPDFAKTSITRRVPTLVHEGFALSESSAICEYIDETFAGTRLYPADRHDRASARQVQAWLRSDLMPIRESGPRTSCSAAPRALPCPHARVRPPTNYALRHRLCSTDAPSTSLATGRSPMSISR